MFDDRFDGCKTSAAGDKDDGFFRIFAQKKGAEWSLETQDIAFLHDFEHMMGKCAADDVTDVELQKLIVMRCIGQRKAARLLILEQNIDVLSGQELQAFIGGQLE